jgi:dihydroorotate dehydrogenase electron transfer subunit
MQQCLAELLESRPYGQAHLLELSAPGIASSACPGQFIHVFCGSDAGRVLRRPYSIFAAWGDRLLILVKRVGPGSDWLADRLAGEVLDILGPLGRGFTGAPEGRCALIAGGTGIAPLHFLARRMSEEGTSPRLYWGMESSDGFGSLPAELAGEMELCACSMDGPDSERRTVLDLFFSRPTDEHEAVYACGPAGMLQRLEEACRVSGKPLQVCMEERMACGVGACQGCAVPVRQPAGGYRMACRDGPVFAAQEIDWERTT